MIAVVSPAKSLDFDTAIQVEATQPRFPDETGKLVQTLKTKDKEDLKNLMSLSSWLAKLNVERYQNFEEQKRKACIFAFQGDVYKGFDADTLGDEELDYAQNHLRILSGLYGLLRPLDEIAPYRLEMGTKLQTHGAGSLYEFWGDKLVEQLHQDLKAQGDNVLVNLASKEYFKAIDRKSLNAQLIDVEFKDFKNGKYKIVSFYAKKARGLMARFMAENKISDPKDLEGFNYEGYAFDVSASDESKLAFKRG